MGNFIAGIISLAISVIVLANVFIYTVKNTSMAGACANESNSSQILSCTNWSVGEIALWGTLSLVAIAGLIYGVMVVFGMV